MFSKPLNCLPPSSAKVARATLEPLLPGPCSIRILRSSGMRGGGAFFFITSIMWPRHFYPSHWQCFRPICSQIIFVFWLCSITTLFVMLIKMVDRNTTNSMDKQICFRVTCHKKIHIMPFSGWHMLLSFAVFGRSAVRNISLILNIVTNIADIVNIAHYCH